MPNPAWKYYAKRLRLRLRLRLQQTTAIDRRFCIQTRCDRQRFHASISISMSGDQSTARESLLLLLSIVPLSRCLANSRTDRQQDTIQSFQFRRT